MTKNKEYLEFDEREHRYRLMPSGVILPSVTQIIDTVFPFIDRGEVTERARQFGSAIHKAIELDIKGTLDMVTLDEALMPYLKQWWKVISHLDILTTQCKTEQMLWSKKYRFSGRIDIVEKRIMDIKSGQPSPTHRIQASAYRHLWQITYKQKMPKAIVIYLNGEDKMPEIVEEQPSDFTTFLSCLEIYNFKKKENIK